MRSTINVCIYSENPDTLRNLLENVKDHLLEKKRDGRIRSIASHTKIIEHFENQRSDDVYIVDFSNYKNALDAIISLRKNSNEAAWICVNVSLKVFMNLLLFQPSGYIPDVTNANAVRQVFGRFEEFHRRTAQNQYFTFKNEGEIMRIPFTNISYFESHAKKVTLHQYNSIQKYHFTAKLEEIQTMVPATFLRCHQSFLVNMERIRLFDTKNHTIIALPNEEVLVSRRMYSAAKEAYEKYLERH